MGDFSLAFKQINDKTEQQLNRIIKKSVFDLTSAIIQDTPVDTSRAKNNWLVSFDSPIDNTVNTLDNSGNTAINKANTKIMANKVPMVYWIQNNLPYIAKLEFGLYPKNSKTGKTSNGFSIQAPSGFVRLNIIRFNKFLKANLKGL